MLIGGRNEQAQRRTFCITSSKLGHKHRPTHKKNAKNQTHIDTKQERRTGIQNIHFGPDFINTFLIWGILVVLLWLGRNFYVCIVGVRLFFLLINTKKPYVESQYNWARKGPLEISHSTDTAQSRFSYSRLLRTMSSWILSISKEGDYNLSEQPLSVFDHPYSTKAFSYV